MKVSLLGLVALIFVVGCSSPPPTNEVAPTPNIEATVETTPIIQATIAAGVKATRIAEEIGYAIKATMSVPTQTPTLSPTATLTYNLKDVMKPSETPGIEGFAILDEMAATLESAMALSAKSVDAAKLGRDLGLQGLYEESIQELSKSIQLAPDFARTYVDRGDIYVKLDEFKRAMEDYDKAIQLKPTFPLAYLNRGVLYAKLGQLPNAIEDWDRVTQLDPNEARAYYNRAIALGLLNQHSLAEEDSIKACELARRYC